MFQDLNKAKHHKFLNNFLKCFLIRIFFGKEDQEICHQLQYRSRDSIDIFLGIDYSASSFQGIFLLVSMEMG